MTLINKLCDLTSLLRGKGAGQIFAVLFGNAAFLASQWAMLIVMPRLLGTESAGYFAMGLAISGPMFMLTGLQLRQVVATDVLKQYSNSQYLHIRFAGTFTALTLITPIAIFLAGTWTAVIVVQSVAIMKAMESFSDLSYGAFLRDGHPKRFAASLGIKALLGFGVFYAVGLYTQSALAALLGVALTYGSIYFLVDLPCLRQIKTKSNVRHSILPLFRKTLPLSIATFLNAVHLQMPNYAVDVFLGSAALAEFAVVFFLTAGGAVIIMSIGHATLPSMASSLLSGSRNDFWRQVKRNLIISFGLVLITILALGIASPFLLKMILPKSQSPVFSPSELFLIVSATALQYPVTTLGHTFFSTRRFDKFMTPYFMIAIVSLTLHFSLTPIFGICGVIFSIAFSNCFSAIIIFRKIRYIVDADHFGTTDRNTLAI